MLHAHQTVGLYLHIPFCIKKCGYCDFCSVAGADSAAVDAYMKALRRHILETAPAAGAIMADTVYVGGGTPTYVGHRRLTELLEFVRRRFKVSKVAEITLEANPDSVTKKALIKLRRAGYNRLSLGVQSLDDVLLRAMGRPHTAAEAETAFQLAREAGFDNVSVDLMYGLPGQTQDDWLKTVDGVLAWKPDHLSCYGLKLEENTPLSQSPDRVNIPADDAQAEMYLAAVERVTARGFVHYEISNFARSGHESRHNLKYWNMEPYLGLGAAAHSDFGGRRWAQVRDVERFVRGIWSGESIVEENEKIPLEERMLEYIMLRLRTKHGISSNEYTRQFRVSFNPIEREMERLAGHGLAERDGDRWCLTARGFLISNGIIGAILDAHTANGAKHT